MEKDFLETSMLLKIIADFSSDVKKVATSCISLTTLWLPSVQHLASLYVVHYSDLFNML
jgi:hypothetical protein